MRTIVVLNPKGGCGKSTIATNIAAYFSIKGKRVTRADCDPQGSSDDWLSARPDKYSGINGIAVEHDGLKIQRNTEILIIDTPAAMEDKRLKKYLRKAQSLVMPIIASPIDIRAAERFLN